jgi:hypothetical protein
MCCNLKHLQRCDTCYNSIKHSCYGYDQGYDCYENIFDKYAELEKKFYIRQQPLSGSDDKSSSPKSCEGCKYAKGVPVNDDKCDHCSRFYEDKYSQDFR